MVMIPRNPTVGIPGDEVIVPALMKLGFLGEFLGNEGGAPPNRTSYSVGPRYLELFDLLPKPVGRHVVDFERTAHIEFIGSEFTEPPKCPWCRFELEDFGAVLDEWSHDRQNYRWSCPFCEFEDALWWLDWHRFSGFAGFAIYCWGVAEPPDVLLHTLAGCTDTEWTYLFYKL